MTHDPAPFEQMDDAELAAAYKSYLDTYHRSYGRERDWDRQRIVLIADVARRQGRYEVVVRAAQEYKERKATS